MPKRYSRSALALWFKLGSARQVKVNRGCSQVDCKPYAQKAKKNQDWRTSNRSEVNAHSAKRRAAKLQRTPLWADKEQIGMWYSVAEVLSRGGVSFHVDHVLPLQGKVVCGFHSHDNLQVLPWFENLRKSAKLKDKNLWLKAYWLYSLYCSLVLASVLVLSLQFCMWALRNDARIHRRPIVFWLCLLDDDFVL